MSGCGSIPLARYSNRASISASICPSDGLKLLFMIYLERGAFPTTAMPPLDSRCGSSGYQIHSYPT
jgi:hypothetical protein